jgi:integrase
MGDKIDNDDPYWPWGFYNAEYMPWAKENRAANTVESQSSAIRMWISEHLDVRLKLAGIKSSDVSKYINSSDNVGLSQRKFRLASVSSFLSLAKSRGYCKGNVAEKLRVKKLKIPFSEDEYLQVKERFGLMKQGDYSPFWHYASCLSYWTGLRLIDCASMDWDSVMIVPDNLVVWTAKAGDGQHARVALPMKHELLGGGMLIDLFNEQLDRFDASSPFIWPREQEMMNNVKKRSLLPQEFIRKMRKFKINNKSFHCLRHSCVTRWRKAGMTLEQIGTLVAHTSTGTTEVYNHHEG